MYICICKNVTEKQVSNAVSNGACSMKEICTQLGIASGCGKCCKHAKEVFDRSMRSARLNSVHLDADET